MKKGIIVMVILILLGSIAIPGCKKEAPTANPEDTVNAFLDAIEAFDAERALSFIIPEAISNEMRQEMKAEFDRAREKGESVSFTNREISVLSQSKYSVKVSLSCDMKHTAEGKVDEEKEIKDIIPLVKRNGKWLISKLPP